MSAMSRPLSILILAMLSVCGIAFATDEDPIKKKLDAAKRAYESELESFGKSVIEWLDKREELARKDGNKKQVDLIKSERAAFQNEGELPKDLPITVRRKATIAKATIEAAYAAAVKEYTKARQDDEASDVEKELADFKAGRTTSTSTGSASTSSGNSESSTLAANNVINPKEWVLPRKGAIVVTKDGHLQLRQADSELVTKKTDYKEVEIRVTLSATKGTVAYLAVGLGGKRPITSAITDDGRVIQVGNQSSHFKSPELGMGPKPIAYDEMFEILMRTSGGVGRVSIADKLVSGVTYDKNGKPEAGAVGLVLRKGSLTIKSVEVKESK